MKTPKKLQALVQDGLIDEVLRPLKSGKEASVYVVRVEDEMLCAKVYKDAQQRSFQQQSIYQEGRKVRNSRQARAIQKGSRFGQQQQEQVWQNAEVEALYQLSAAGVRVPKPHNFIEGVLLMELITDADGNAAPRLNDVVLSPEQALAYHALLLKDVVRMLCAGLIHGDLSEYNILLDSQSPVIIDLPQAVNAAANLQASVMLERDVHNLARYFGQFAPQLLNTDYGKEIWQLYQSGVLHPDVTLTGQFKHSEKKADVRSVLREIQDAKEEAMQRKLLSL